MSMTLDFDEDTDNAITSHQRYPGAGAPSIAARRAFSPFGAVVYAKDGLSPLEGDMAQAPAATGRAARAAAPHKSRPGRGPSTGAPPKAATIAPGGPPLNPGAAPQG